MVAAGPPSLTSPCCVTAGGQTILAIDLGLDRGRRWSARFRRVGRHGAPDRPGLESNGRTFVTASLGYASITE